MKKVLEKYIDEKFNFEEEAAEEVYSFLDDLSRYSFCEAIILSTSDSIFHDFIETEKKKALSEFDKYYGIIEDYDLDIYQIAREGTFFTSIWKELDALLIELYWRSISRGKPSKVQKENLQDLLDKFLSRIEKSGSHLDKVVPKLILFLKKNVVIEAVLSLKKQNKTLDQRKIENFMARRLETFEELEESIGIMLGKKKGKEHLNALRKKESWYFEGGFEKALKSLLTNNIINLPNIINVFKRIQKLLVENAKDEAILSQIYKYRRIIFCSLSNQDGEFYEQFIKENKIQFKHTGTYGISYLKDDIALVESALRLIGSKRLDKVESGYLAMEDIVSEIRAKIRLLFRENKIGYKKVLANEKSMKRKKRQTHITSKYKWISTKEFSLSAFSQLEDDLHEQQLMPVTKISSLILCYRKCGAYIHLLATQIDLDNDEARELFNIFTIFFVDALFESKYEEE